MPILDYFLLTIILMTFFTINNGQPLYLCNETTREAHLETEYTAADQCTRWGTEQMQHNAFALRFQLSGKCENGMLICYPGSLDPSGANSAYGMSPEIQFQVQNRRNNEVSNQCLAYQRKCDTNKWGKNCNERTVWHGIRVRAPKSSADGETMIELSITKETYNIGITRIFSIEFGSPRNLRTKITDEKGDEIKFWNDDAIRGTYLARKVKRDAQLRNYVGLWMLGLDILPMLNRDKVQLHVVRDCGCEMHAWFVHPADEVPPVEAENPVVSADCPAKVRDTDSQRFALATPANIGRAIYLRQRLNKHPGGIELRFGNEAQRQLLVLQLNQPPYGLINISSARTKQHLQAPISDDESLEERGDDALEKENEADIGQFKTFGSEQRSADEDKWVDKYLDVALVLHKYFYEVKVGDRNSVSYFPNSTQWWTEGQIGNITRIEIAGDVYPASIDEPKVMEKPQKDSTAGQSYTKRFEGALDAGDTVVIRGKIGESAAPANSDDGEATLSFYLMHNSPKFNVYVSKVAWFLFQSNGTLRMGHYNFVEKYHIDPDATLGLFKPNEPFEMRMQMTQMENEEIGLIKITVLTPTRSEETTFKLLAMAFRDINFLNIVGTIELFESPYLVPPKDYGYINRMPVFHVFPLLVVGDSIRIEGKLSDNATMLKIELLHDSSVPNPYFGNLVLQVTFNMEQSVMLLNTFINNLLFSNNVDLMQKFPAKLFPGEEFNIEIRVEFNEYKIFVYGALAATYEHILPPWAVSYLNLRGDYTSISNFALDRTKSIFCEHHLRSLALPFVMEIPQQKMLQFGDSITIQGTVTKENALVLIVLLNEAVETYNSVSPSIIRHLLNGTTTMVGTIVTRAIFTTDLDGKGSVEFTYNDEVEELNFEPALTMGQQFHLRIVMRDRPEFHLEGYGKFVFDKDTMPVWAIQYIRVEGDLELSEMPRIEFSRRKRDGHSVTDQDNK